jgi:cephalosporin hydroxylase
MEIMTLAQHHDAWQALVAGRLSGRAAWRGVTCHQHPADLARCARRIRELKPPWLLRTAIGRGGTMAFLADTMRKVNPESRCMFADTELELVKCRVSTGTLPGAEVYMGSTVSPVLFREFARFAGGERGIVFLGGNRDAGQVTAELDLYAAHASYLVAEGTAWDNRVTEALSTWLESHPEFAADPDPQPSQHPGGWLRRVSDSARG